ncbi:uncharacterized protein LOC113309365 isoform X2 [Papaver somniferum]|uniref:uncharacterized protein LOC113309365 isoform X2 n=1 Tax=Papaver somniferum TaxID=3469 RepID=UPI000E70564B|nr:uncharacterized protein LOC113309365 isoform X2 [Papaver somniferum]
MAQNPNYVCNNCRIPIVREADALVLDLFIHSPGTVIRMANQTVGPLRVDETVYQFHCPVRKVNVKNVALICRCDEYVGIFYYHGDASKTDPRQHIYHMDVYDRLLYVDKVKLAP